MLDIWRRGPLVCAAVALLFCSCATPMTTRGFAAGYGMEDCYRDTVGVGPICVAECGFVVVIVCREQAFI